MGVSALKLREGCRCRSECGDWQASRAHAKQFWEVCPKRGGSKPEEPSLRRRGLEEQGRWETPACWLRTRHSPLPPVPGPLDLGRRGPGGSPV